MVGLGRLVVPLAAAGVLVGVAGTSTGSARWFFTPGPNGASCEIDVGRPGIATSAWCLIAPLQVTMRNTVAVRLRPSGKIHVCHGCIGNAPNETPTLGYGRSVELGPFRCTSLRAGVRCIVKKLGHGFLLGAHGVTHI